MLGPRGWFSTRWVRFLSKWRTEQLQFEHLLTTTALARNGLNGHFLELGRASALLNLLMFTAVKTKKVIKSTLDTRKQRCDALRSSLKTNKW